MPDISTLEREIVTLKNMVGALNHSVQELTGRRLNVNELAQRLGVHRTTLRGYREDPRFPRPGLDGKWLLSEVIEWEALKAGEG